MINHKALKEGSMALRPLRRWHHVPGISERTDPDDVKGTLKPWTECCCWNQLLFQGLSLPGPFVFLLPNFPVYLLYPQCVCVCVCVCARSVLSDSLQPCGL